jgi:hypothetical protein
MSGCVARRWAGTGTTTERPTDPALAKEMNERLKQIQSERTQMDSMWNAPASNTQLVVVEQPQVEGKIAIPVFDKTKSRGF